METLLLTCLQSHLMISRINANPHLSSIVKNDLVWEVKQITPKKCNVDAKAD